MAASVSSFALGLAVFAVYQMHRARRKAQAEVAFEAALQDSGLGLDDAFEQVIASLLGNKQLAPLLSQHEDSWWPKHYSTVHKYVCTIAKNVAVAQNQQKSQMCQAS